ncbi:MAG: hypothetical protein IPL01_16825 [Acidobacteria bacterium]|nr:hypothetical protein [Acidobacteriota bacterium]
MSTVSTPSTQPVRAAEFLRVNVPAVTHGFTKTSALPDGDLFLLPRPFSMAVTEVTEGAKYFPGYESFGGEAENVGSLPTTQPQGFSFSARNSKVKITSCDESIWDSNFIIASTQGTDGDLIRLFLDNPDGTKARAGIVHGRPRWCGVIRDTPASDALCQRPVRTRLHGTRVITSPSAAMPASAECAPGC